jgi:hypothetical protein
LVLEEAWVGDFRSIEKQRGGVETWRGFHWWPLGGARLHEAVPQTVLSAFVEAMTALEAGCPRAAAIMGRSTLEAVVTDQGEPRGQALAKGLQNLVDKGRLHPSLVEWTKEVRLIGNEAAHDPLTAVSKDDARQLLSFIRELANYLYVLPFELNKRRADKSEQPPAPPK